MPPFNQSWKCFLGAAYVDEWRDKARELYAQQGQQVYPQQAHVFRAFNVCPLDCLKVVIVGEEPYENGNADGLAFSVSGRARVPPSLCNILSEIRYDLDIAVRHDGNLVRWAQQGVLLLNSKLTIGRRRQWGYFTQFVLKKISEEKDGIVFMLWGALAQDRGEHIVNHNDEHLVLRSSHPSPQSAFNMPDPFVGCQHFSQAREWLEQRELAVDWS